MSSRREKEIKERLHPILAQLRTNHGHNGAVAWGPHKRQAENLRALAAEEMAIIADFIDRRFTWKMFGRHHTMRAIYELAYSLRRPANEVECKDVLAVELLAIKAKSDEEWAAKARAMLVKRLTSLDALPK